MELIQTTLYENNEMGNPNNHGFEENKGDIDQNQNDGGLTESQQKFHEVVSTQIKRTVKNFEIKLDSVRKEREAVIVILENVAKEVFEPQS